MKLLGIKEDSWIIRNRKLWVSKTKEPRPLITKPQANPLTPNVEGTMGIGHTELDRMCATNVGSLDLC